MAVSTIDPNGLNIGQIGGTRNRIINGSFQIWQRGTSFTSDAYTADRWYMSLGGSTGTVSQQSFTVGQTDVPDEPNNYLRFNISSYVAEFNLFQRIEDVRTFAGQTAVLSFYMKADSALTVSPFMVQNFGSGGSSNVNTTLSTISVTTSWQRFEITISVPSISGKTVGSSSYLQIMPLRVTSSFTGNIDIAQVQLEVGDTATPFEHRSYGQELALCQRYFQTGGNSAGRAYSTQALQTYYQFPVQMRATPTITKRGAGNAINMDTGRAHIAGVNNYDISTVVGSDAHQNGVLFTVTTTTASMSSGAAAGLRGNPANLDAEL